MNRAAILAGLEPFADCYTYGEFQVWIKRVTLDFAYGDTINWHQIVTDAFVRKGRAFWFIQDNGVPFAFAFWCGPRPD